MSGRRLPARVITRVQDRGINAPAPEVHVALPSHEWMGNEPAVVMHEREAAMLDAAWDLLTAAQRKRIRRGGE